MSRRVELLSRANEIVDDLERISIALDSLQELDENRDELRGLSLATDLEEMARARDEHGRLRDMFLGGVTRRSGELRTLMASLGRWHEHLWHSAVETMATVPSTDIDDSRRRLNEEWGLGAYELDRILAALLEEDDGPVPAAPMTGSRAA